MDRVALLISAAARPVRYLAADGTERLGVYAEANVSGALGNGGPVVEILYDLAEMRPVEDAIAIR